VQNNPATLTDPSGHCAVDTLADVAFLIYDLYRLTADNLLGGDPKALEANLTALGLDGAGALVPCATGLGTASRVARGAVKAERAGSAAGKPVMHHMVPKEILKDPRISAEVAKVVRGKRGAPNKWAIPEEKHLEIHRGAGGGKYNDDWKQKLIDLGRDPTVDDVLRIRDELAQKYDLERYRP
ncbi:MAG: hypothetical protein ACKVVP_07815, partial [Chloroflexota bacterium]